MSTRNSISLSANCLQGPSAQRAEHQLFKDKKREDEPHPGDGLAVSCHPKAIPYEFLFQLPSQIGPELYILSLYFINTKKDEIFCL
jgi:hypothetical protein